MILGGIVYLTSCYADHRAAQHRPTATQSQPQLRGGTERCLPFACRRYLPANPSELSIFDKAVSFFIVNIAVPQTELAA